MSEQESNQRRIFTVTQKQRRRTSSRTIIHARIRPESSSTVRTNMTRKSKVMPIDKEISFHSSQLTNSRGGTDSWSEEKLSFGELRDIKERSKKKRRKRSWKFYCVQCPWGYCILGAIILGLLLTILLLQLLPKSTATTTITTTVTSVTTTTITLTTTTTVTVTTTTTSVTTTTTTVVCGSSCDTQTWLDSTDLLAQWQFDNDLIESVSNTNTPSEQSPTYVTGYIRKGLLFDSNVNQSVISSPVALTSSSSFTFDAWIYPTGFNNPEDHTIVGLCPLFTHYECLYLTIRFDNGIYALHFGLYGTELTGTTPISLNEWIHVAFVLEVNSLTQSIYLNGKLEATQTASGPFKGNADSVTIGNVPALNSGGGSATNYFQGIIDRVQVSERDKSSCEILEEATLSAYFSFNSGKELIDSGPNSLSAVAQSVSYVSTGHSLQAISFNGSSSSYYQISDVTSLGISDRPFSLSLWIRPRSASGVLVHISSNSTGTGWYFPFIGFAANGSIVAQMYSLAAHSVTGPSILLYPFWTHIVQTWSSANGLRLYVNSALVASTNSMGGSYVASSQPNYVTLGNSLMSAALGVKGALGSMDPFDGDIDEFRIYSRELYAFDICSLYLR